MNPNQLWKEKTFRSRRMCDSHNSQNLLEEFVPSALISIEISCSKGQVADGTGRSKLFKSADCACNGHRGTTGCEPTRETRATRSGVSRCTRRCCARRRFGLDGQTRPKYPRIFPLPGNFIESSQAVTARWITRTIKQQQQTTAQQTEWQREFQQLQKTAAVGPPKQVETLAPRMREKFQSYNENKWELVRQRAKENLSDWKMHLKTNKYICSRS